MRNQSVAIADDAVRGVPKVERYAWTVVDRPGTLRFIDKMQLFVDKIYQRKANDAKILAIAREWSWSAFGAVSVAERFGTFYVIDGQHRVLAAKKRSDVTELPCVVFQTSSVTQEAESFLKSNTMRRPVSSVEKFKALVVTNDSVAVIASVLIEDAGRVVSEHPGPNAIRCVGSLQSLIRQNVAVVERIWPVVNELCDGHVLHERILQGLFYIEVRMPDGESLSDARWRRRLRNTGYQGLIDGATRAASFFARGGPKVWATGMVEAINHKCRHRLIIGDA